ncbi:MAG: bifunctional UDP-N-acetylglucosamine diphosphorylase/glucosamine-1-phosphate N-acetyltransferase GlmU [Proteobacteria bacterium]|nr:bifunctional UDP-N-acetylglucosamine diphosphorylase/glucosamine-1-phosphate N-acetyltransferase GlmU [Pseudomonadota bacterium]
MPEKTAIIIMAAGAGTRFKSKKSKLLHNVAGKPAIKYLSDMMIKLNPEQAVFVLSHQKDEVMNAIGDNNAFSFVEQKTLDGTAGAVRVAMTKIKPEVTRVIVLPGDTPTIPEMLVRELMVHTAPIVLVGTELNDPKGFGRIKVDEDNNVIEIIEETDLKGFDRNIKLVNTSIYSFNRKFLEKSLSEITLNPNKKEFYLTDIIAIARNTGLEIRCLKHDDPEQVLGANDRFHFAHLGAKVWLDRTKKHSEAGVSFICPERTYVDEDVQIGKDSAIYPDVFITGNTVIDEDVTILEGCRINNSKISSGSIIGPYVIMDEAEIGSENKIGPFTFVRPGTKTKKKVKIGAFVETKKVTVDEGSKIPHLSYMGDASIGKNTNIGCGVITCNYDGFTKSKTEIGDNVFIGSDSQLIAPVKINDDSYVAAGTTVTNEVPSGDLAISRVKQKNLDGYAKKIREKKAKK